MKEIGGYFELEKLISNEYYKELIPLNSGRNALLYLLKAKKIKKVYIPYYLCDSVSNMLKEYGYDFEFYNINVDFMPTFHNIIGNDEILYIVNYYGQLDNDQVIQLKQRYGRIILDNVHAFFQKPIKGIDTIYSCRKFFGVPDGAYLATNIRIKNALETSTSKERMSHIIGRYEGLASDFYHDFKNNDETFNTETLKYMSKLTHNILGAIGYKEVCKIRNKNYAYLDEKLGRYNKIKLKVPNGAYAYPFYVKNGIDARKELAKKNIYIPTIWPNVLINTQKGDIGHDYAANILPLPCDQRYTVEDAKYVVHELMNYIAANNLVDS